jgi:hypothetical protein
MPRGKKKPILIEVTEHDIKKGKPKSKCDCPIGLAVQRVFQIDPDADDDDEIEVDWMVGGDDLALLRVVKDKDDRSLHWLLPPEAAAFIKRFDNKKKVEAFSFELKNV